MMFLWWLLLVPFLYFIFYRPYWYDDDAYRMHPHEDRDGSNIYDKNGARTILDTKYVNGEITDEEYKTKKANLA